MQRGRKEGREITWDSNIEKGKRENASEEADDSAQGNAKGTIGKRDSPLYDH